MWLSVNAKVITHGDQQATLITFENITALKLTQFLLESAHSELKEKVSKRTAELESANQDMATLNLQLIKRERERMQAQKALEESEKRFRSIFENNHAVMLIIEPSSGMIVDANPAAASYYGYSEDQLKAMNIADINTLSTEAVQEEMRLARLRKRNHFNFRHRLASGEVREVEVFSGPVHDKSTQLLYSIVHDITDRRKTEQRLKLFERIVASSPDLISLVDREYRYRMVNDAYLTWFKKTREELLGTQVSNVLGDDFFATVVKPKLDKTFEGETLRTESSISLPDRGYVHFAGMYHPVMNYQGEVEFVSVTSRDISDRKEHEEALEKYSSRLSLATDAGRIGIWDWDITTGELHWDDIMLELYQVEPSDFNGFYEAWKARVHPEDISRTEKNLGQAMAAKTPFESEFRIIHPSGEIRHIKAAAITQFSEGKAIRMIGVNQDVTRTRTMEQELRRLATTDELTGANNRRHFMSRAEEEIARANRYGTPVTILTLDIDLFKRVNDTYGHPVGDKVLIKLVKVCLETLRITDIFARMGGEEFSAILPETDIDNAAISAERVRQAIQRTSVPIDNGKVVFTVSLGISQLRNRDDTLDSLMRRADKALYRAKALGRNRVEVE